jgi:hypothetical protein
MILVLRRLRMKLLQTNQFTKYMAYAFGEIILVVIGILIALQINNWNQDKVYQGAVKGYLTSIARNIQSDLGKVEALRDIRQLLSSRIPYVSQIAFWEDNYSINDIKFISETFQRIIDLDYFVADLSGYDSLKSSGYLSKLQGKDLELLLYRYYNLVEEISIKETDYNDILRNAHKEFMGVGFEDMVYFSNVGYIQPKRINLLQDSLSKIVRHQTASQVYSQSDIKSPVLVTMYDNLTIIGNQLVRMIEKAQFALDNEAMQAMDDIYELDGDIGYAKIIVDGARNAYFYDEGFAQVDEGYYDSGWTEYALNEWQIYFKAQAWGLQYITVASDALVARPTKDYSGYNTLKLELKAPESGQTVLVILKDAQDKDDGSETRVPLIISDEWQTYEIPLSEFKTADLKQLYVVVGFLFLENAQTLSVRNVEYLK